MLNFLEFLKKAVQNYSFIQISKINTVLSKYKTHDEFGISSSEQLSFMLLELQALNLQVEESEKYSDVAHSLNNERLRTSDEIGTGHILNDRSKLDLEDFTGESPKNLQFYKEQIVQLVEKMQKDIKESI